MTNAKTLLEPKKFTVWIWWICICLLVGGAIFLLRDMLLPFVISAILSYFLNPIVTRMEKLHLSRGWSTLLILIGFLGALVAGTMVVAPILYEQGMALIQELPHYFERAQAALYSPKHNQLLGLLQEKHPRAMQEMSKQLGPLLGMSGNVFANLLHSGKTVLGGVAMSMLVTIITFYMLKDWPMLLKNIERLIPRTYHATAMAQFHDMDRTLSRYLHGQANACLVLGLYYAIGLTAISLPYGFVLGFSMGIFSFIPYMSLIIGIFGAVVVAYFSFGLSAAFVTVIGILALGQLIEASIVGPKLVGDKIGVHPLWLLFAVLAAGTLFGFLGVLLAVPATAALSVLSRFTVNKYLESPAYNSKSL